VSTDPIESHGNGSQSMLGLSGSNFVTVSDTIEMDATGSLISSQVNDGNVDKFIMNDEPMGTQNTELISSPGHEGDISKKQVTLDDIDVEDIGGSAEELPEVIVQAIEKIIFKTFKHVSLGKLKNLVTYIIIFFFIFVCNNYIVCRFWFNQI